MPPIDPEDHSNKTAIPASFETSWRHFISAKIQPGLLRDPLRSTPSLSDMNQVTGFGQQLQAT
jgi:hypothetical protein